MSKWKELEFNAGQDWSAVKKGDRLIVKYKECEQEPVIKKSGGTWVIKENEIDYLVMEPKSPYFKPDQDLNISRLVYDDVIKPITEITITDEIAKLRPAIIVVDNSDLCTLYGVSNDIAVLLFGTIEIARIRLATATDLTNQE